MLSNNFCILVCCILGRCNWILFIVLGIEDGFEILYCV